MLGGMGIKNAGAVARRGLVRTENVPRQRPQGTRERLAEPSTAQPAGVMGRSSASVLVGMEGSGVQVCGYEGMGVRTGNQGMQRARGRHGSG